MRVDLRAAAVSRSLAAALLGLALCASACAPAPAPPADEQPAARPETGPPGTDKSEQAVLEAHRALVRGYESGSMDSIALLLATSREPVIFHPRVEHRFDGAERVRSGLVRMFDRLGQASWTEAHPMIAVHGDTGWVTYHVLIESPRLKRPVLGRGTEIWIREGGAWKLAHAHWSETPGVFDSASL